MKYPKAFDKYWRNAEVGINLPEITWVSPQVKRVAFRAWLAGRRYERK